MDSLKLDLWTFDVGAEMGSPEDCAAWVVSRVQSSWNEGAEIVVFPEFMWMALERFVDGPEKLEGVASLFWRKLWPGLEAALHREDKAVVLGSVPFLDDAGVLRNRAPILSEGRVWFQDKIHLTPWESRFSGGGPLRIWEFKGVRIATVICLDIEIPELCVALRGKKVDLLLVPSATENVLGVERVGRCASARAVELGCYVAVCQLVGCVESELIDENIGRISVYSPSQTAFLPDDRLDESVIFTDGFHRRSLVLNLKELANARKLVDETNPSKVPLFPIEVVEVG